MVRSPKATVGLKQAAVGELSPPARAKVTPTGHLCYLPLWSDYRARMGPRVASAPGSAFGTKSQHRELPAGTPEAGLRDALTAAPDYTVQEGEKKAAKG